MKVPSGWQYPRAASAPNKGPLADLGLGHTHHPAGPRVLKPVQHDRGYGAQADLQASGGLPPCPGRAGSKRARWSASQVRTLAGSDDPARIATRPDLLWKG